MRAVRCPCGSHADFEAFRRHRDAGLCPRNEPRGTSGAWIRWALLLRPMAFPVRTARRAMLRPAAS